MAQFVSASSRVLTLDTLNQSPGSMRSGTKDVSSFLSLFHAWSQVFTMPKSGMKKEQGPWGSRTALYEMLSSLGDNQFFLEGAGRRVCSGKW